jgi:regulatory protein
VNSDLKRIQDSALVLLARREHSRRELAVKLAKKYAQPDLIEQVLQELEQSGWLSDMRFAAAYISARASRGFGPQCIQQELRVRGVDAELIEQMLLETDVDWKELAKKVRIKKFGSQAPKTFLDKVKQQRFMQYRGFEFQHEYEEQ